MVNDGTTTLSSTGALNFDGGSSMTNGGVLTDNNSAADSISLTTGGLTITGGTICGTAPSLNSTPLTFSGMPVAGPNCPAGVAEDVIQARSGTEVLTGTVPAGYTIVDNATVSTTTSVTNDGSLVLADGVLIISSTNTFTNSGSFDTTSANGTLDANTSSGGTFVNGSGGNWTIEGTLTVGSNGSAPALTNSGFLGIAPGAGLNLDSSVTLTNTPSGTVAFGIDGVNTSSSNYGEINGKTDLQGGTLDPVDDNGYVPVSGTEYFVMVGTNTGTFTTVLHNATADYTHSGETGVVGGAPATPTTTTVTSTANPAAFGQPVSLTATVTTSSGTPTGSVTFYDGTTAIGTQSVSTSNGTTTASIEISALRVGSDSVTAVYSGDAVFNSSTSALYSETVNQDGPTVSVNPNPTSLVPGQPDVITVDVTAAAPGAGTPTGDVSLTDGGSPIPGCQDLVMGPTGPSQVSCDVTYQSVADHTIGATYAGDTDFTGGSGSSPLDVSAASTTTVLTPSANPAPLGEAITYTATVTVNNPGSGTPTGTVSFTDGGIAILGCQNLTLPASAPLSVQCAQTYSAVVSHSIVATYAGTVNYKTSSDTVSEGVQQLGTTTTIGDSTGSSIYGLPVTFTATIAPSPGGSASPTGTVSFEDNGSTGLGSAPVSTASGVTTATLTLSNLPAGAHSVQATFGGDTTYVTSSSSTAATVNVAQAGTSVAVTNAANPSVVGQQITLSATVTPASGSGPTGTVQFYDSGTALGPAETVSGGVATLTTSGLALGSHSITAIYSGDTNFQQSTTLVTFSQVVNHAGTTTSLVPSANPGPLGVPITYTATVTVNSPGSGTPSGTISFTDGGNPISVCQNMNLPATAPFSVQCQQTYTSDVGHTIEATYTSATTSYQSSNSGLLNESLAEATTTTGVTVSTGSTTYGQPVSFTATVTPELGSSGNPTGSVTFVNNDTDPATDLGSAPVSTTAGVTTAQLSLPYLSAGSYSVQATYGGDSVFTESTSSSTSPATVTVSRVTAGVGVTSSAAASVVGQSVTLTATITPAVGAGPTGTVQFYDNGTAIGPAESVSSGVATLTTSALALGSHPITAIYSGDGNFTGATTTASFPQMVNQAGTSTVVTSSANPGEVGVPITYTATVTVNGPGGGTPTGKVSFTDGGSAITGCQNLTLPATAPFSAQCQQTYATNSSHSIVATYAGDTNYTGSANAAYPESVSQVNTSTAIGASTDSTTYGQSVTFTATVTAATGTPTGSVTFFDNGTNIGTSALSTTAGVTTANLPLATLPAGPDTVTAQYGGTTEFAGSSTPPAGVVVNVAKAATTTATVTSNLNPSVSGQSVTFTAAITVNAPGAGTPTGTVTFYDNGTAIGTGTVGTSVPPGPAIGASLTISSLSVATHPITASYGGDTNFVGSSTGSALQQVVNGSQVGTTTVIENAPSVTTTVSQVPTLVAGVTGGSAPFPSGTVTFKQGTTVLGTAPLVEQSAADLAQLPVPQFSSTYAIGTHTITAVYSGDGTHIGSTSAPVTLTVVSPIFEDIDLGEEFVVLNSQTGAVANSFFDGSNSCGCNGQDYLAISPDGTRAYMLDPGSSTSTVHVINTATGAVLASISVSGWAGDIVTSPDGTHVYVGTYNSSSNTLDVISTATNTVTSSIAVTGGGILTAMAINPAGTEMFVTLQTAVAVVNLSTQRTVADIALSGAEGIAVNPNGSAAYATNGFHGGAAHSNTVSVISTSTDTVTRTFTGFTEPTNLTVNPAGTALYVTSVAGGNGFVTGVNLSSGTETNLTLPSSDSGQDLAVSPNGATLYLSFNSLTNNDGVFEINTSNLQIATTLSPLGGFATDDTIRPFGGAPTAPTLTPMSITTTSLPGAAKGQYYSTALAATGGLSPYSWQLTGGTLPAGLTLSPAGTLYGTPTTAGGPVSLTFTASDSNFPTDTATATLQLTIASGSTAPPPCGGSEAGSAPGLPAPSGCASGSNTNPSGSATATSTGTDGSIAVTATGTGGVTVGQYGTEPSSGVPFRGSGNGFDVSLSQINTFTTVTIRDCALDGATSLSWYNPAANGGTGAWVTVSPAVYTPPRGLAAACLTITLSATSSPPLADLDGTNFFGEQPSETVAVTVGGSSPYTISGSVLGGAITINQGVLTTTVTGTVQVLDSSGGRASVTDDLTCILGACLGTVSVSDPAAGVSFTTPAFVSLGTLTTSSANEQGLVIPGGHASPYPVQWSVTETLPSSGS